MDEAARKLRADARASTLGRPKAFRSRVVAVGGVNIEVRQPTIAARAAILKAAKAQSGDSEKVELAALQVESVIRCSYVPGTSERVFEDADREDLMNQPAGGFVDELAEVALELLNVDAKELEKNSAGTPSASSSSP